MSLFSFVEARTSDAFRRSLTVCLPLVKPSLSASTPAILASIQVATLTKEIILHLPMIIERFIWMDTVVAQASCSTAWD